MSKYFLPRWFVVALFAITLAGCQHREGVKPATVEYNPGVPTIVPTPFNLEVNQQGAISPQQNITENCLIFRVEVDNWLATFFIADAQRGQRKDTWDFNPEGDYTQTSTSLPDPFHSNPEWFTWMASSQYLVVETDGHEARILALAGPLQEGQFVFKKNCKS